MRFYKEKIKVFARYSLIPKLVRKKTTKKNPRLILTKDFRYSKEWLLRLGREPASFFCFVYRKFTKTKDLKKYRQVLKLSRFYKVAIASFVPVWPSCKCV